MKRRRETAWNMPLNRSFHEGPDLVPIEAELARAEGRAYESASQLLERIQANGASSRKGKGVRARPKPSRERRA